MTIAHDEVIRVCEASPHRQMLGDGAEAWANVLSTDGYDDPEKLLWVGMMLARLFGLKPTPGCKLFLTGLSIGTRVGRADAIRAIEEGEKE